MRIFAYNFVSAIIFSVTLVAQVARVPVVINFVEPEKIKPSMKCSVI